VIDLHLHTTASDGRSSPADLVQEAYAAGIRTVAVTDHDTMAAVPAVQAAAAAAGMDFVPGIEVTAVHAGRDVHVLGYDLRTSDELEAFLTAQRAIRRQRIDAIGNRLTALGVPIDLSYLVSGGTQGRSLGRPLVAAALVAAGHARDVSDAFDRWLAEGRPAFVERSGVGIVEVIARIRRAGGFASIAHPGKLKRDDLIPEMAAAGMSAVEVFHPDHDEDAVVRYRQLARTLRLVVTGGSDYHGPGTDRAHALGRVTLPADEYRDLVAARAAARPA
jgi:predicted metal-dependent phosphoesterase TrpH